jgi:guanosine-3',5'-bis(diphosphate) 3'-pyrophosphohydrolase
MLLTASAFAADKHRGQRRKGADALPYINHPIAVANVLASEAGITDPVTLAAALLHDTVEDTATTFAELIETFGPEVAGVVAEVTDDKALPKEARKRLQVEHAATVSKRAQLVKLADKICNLRDLTKSPPVDWPLERKQEYFDWAAMVIDRMRGVSPELERAFDAEYGKRPRQIKGKRIGAHAWPRSFLTRLKGFDPATSLLAKRHQRTGAQPRAQIDVPRALPDPKPAKMLELIEQANADTAWSLYLNMDESTQAYVAERVSTARWGELLVREIEHRVLGGAPGTAHLAAALKAPKPWVKRLDEELTSLAQAMTD